jgi:hypothetical protein
MVLDDELGGAADEKCAPNVFTGTIKHVVFDSQPATPEDEQSFDRHATLRSPRSGSAEDAARLYNPTRSTGTPRSGRSHGGRPITKGDAHE